MKPIFCCITFIVFTLSLVGCLPKAPLSPMEEADIAYSSALDQQASGEHEAAIAEFKQYIGQFPKSQDADNAQLGIGDIHYAKGEFQAAIDAYQTILTQYPTSDSADLAQLKIGDAYLAQGDLTQSTAAYHQLVEKYPYHEVEAAQLAEQRLHTIETIRTLRQSLPTAEQSTQDNIQYRLGTLYFEELADYKTAIEEFQKLISLTPDSKLADNAQWMIGECYWRLGQSDPTPPLGEIGEALVRRQHIIDRYPQLAGLDRYNTDGSPHWPTGGRGDRYELYFAELRRLLNRYPDLKARKWSDFVSENYRHALSAWDMLLLQYPDTDAAAIAPQKIAERFVQLGQTYMNLSSGGSYSDLSGLILKASLAYWPTPQAHIALAYYYAEIVKYDRWTYYRTRPFEHLKEAAKLVPPGSPLAAEIRSIKEQMNYRLRIEELENHSGPRQR